MKKSRTGWSEGHIPDQDVITHSDCPWPADPRDHVAVHLDERTMNADRVTVRRRPPTK